MTTRKHIRAFKKLFIIDKQQELTTIFSLFNIQSIEMLHQKLIDWKLSPYYDISERYITRNDAKTNWEKIKPILTKSGKWILSKSVPIAISLISGIGIPFAISPLIGNILTNFKQKGVELNEQAKKYFELYFSNNDTKSPEDLLNDISKFTDFAGNNEDILIKIIHDEISHHKSEILEIRKVIELNHYDPAEILNDWQDETKIMLNAIMDSNQLILGKQEDLIQINKENLDKTFLYMDNIRFVQEEKLDNIEKLIQKSHNDLDEKLDSIIDHVSPKITKETPWIHSTLDYVRNNPTFKKEAILPQLIDKPEEELLIFLHEFFSQLPLPTLKCVYGMCQALPTQINKYFGKFQNLYDLGAVIADNAWPIAWLIQKRGNRKKWKKLQTNLWPYTNEELKSFLTEFFCIEGSTLDFLVTYYFEPKMTYIDEQWKFTASTENELNEIRASHFEGIKIIPNEKLILEKLQDISNKFISSVKFTTFMNDGSRYNNICFIEDEHVKALHYEFDADMEFPIDLITQLPHLQIISIIDLHLDSVLDEIHKIEDLNGICIYFQSKTEIPKKLANFPQLEVLVLSNFADETIPKFFKKFDRLKILKLRKSDLCSIPSWINKLKSLKMIQIESSHLKDLPNSLADLEDLSLLDISQTNLCSLGEYTNESPKFEKLINNLENKGCKITKSLSLF